MKSFSRQIEEINGGRDHSEISFALEELLMVVRDTAKGGSLTVTLSVAPSSRASKQDEINQVILTLDHKLVLPKFPRKADVFYLTENNETTREHPYQQSLVLTRGQQEQEEVPQPKQA